MACNPSAPPPYSESNLYPQISMSNFTSGAGFEPGTVGSVAHSIVELSLSASNLKDMDVFSKSDPMCVVYVKPLASDRWMEVIRTETIQNTLNPKFVTKVKMTYLFEETQHLKFDMYDIDSKSAILSNHDFIGTSTCTLAQIVTAPPPGFQMVLTDSKKSKSHGTLVVSSEELAECRDDVKLQFLGKKLDRKDVFGSSDPFLQFSKSTEDGTFVVVHRTEVVKNCLSPTWSMFEVPVSQLCNGDLDRNIHVECFDHNRNGSHSLIGDFFVTLRQLMRGPGDTNVFELINSKKRQKKKNYRNSGKIYLINIEVIQGFSFLDYVRGGTELACTISIDFTQSNGQPNDPRSLHFMYSPTANPYEVAIKAVGKIIEDYDSDKLFPVLGFGARLPNSGKLSHCFFVNLHDSNPYCAKTEGVLSAYKSCLQRIQLYGPTNFAPSINHVATFARSHMDGSQYFILLIITDGIITDLPQTKQAIVDASTLPLSIIIIGVGNADFSYMEELDGDSVRVTAPDGRAAARDIVQFVAIRDFLSGNRGSEIARVLVAKEVLEEVPGQLVSFMKSRRIRPGRPRTGLPSQLPPDPERFLAGVF